MKVKSILLAAALASACFVASAQSSGSSAVSVTGNTSTDAVLQGRDGFDCTAGSTYQMVNGMARCKTTAGATLSLPSSCAIATLSQGSCTFNFPAATSGSTPSVASQSMGFSGIGSSTCVNGAWGPLHATCAPSQCAASTTTFGSCSFSFPAIQSGQASTVSTTTANYNGSATATCSAGSLALSGQTCSVQPPCPAGTVTWSDSTSGTGASCSAAVANTPSGSAVNANFHPTYTQLVNEPGTSTTGGSAGFMCTNGAWALNPSLAQYITCNATFVCAAAGSPSFNSQTGLWSGPYKFNLWGKGCGATLTFGAQLANQDISALPVQQVAQNGNPGYHGYATYSCAGPIAPATPGVGGEMMATWFGQNSSALLGAGYGTQSLASTCGDLTPTCSQQYIAYTTAACSSVPPKYAGYSGTGTYGSIVFPVTSACDSTTSEAWSTSTSTYPIGAQHGCSTTASSINDYLGMPQVADPNGAKGSTSKFTHTAISAGTPTLSLVLNGTGAWSVVSTMAGVTTVVGNGTWNTLPSATYQYQVLAAQDLTGNGGLTPNGTAFSMPVQSAWATISGAMTVMSCTPSAGQKTCSGEWVVNVRAAGTTAPVYSNAIILSETGL